MQYIIMYTTMDMERDDFCGYEIVVGGLRLVCGVHVGRLQECEFVLRVCGDMKRDSRSLELV
jgi:hypothetical protein